jgi:hypothetical protein
MLQLERWANIKFCQKLGKSTSETFQMIKQAYGKEALGRRAVFKWHRGETVWKMMSIPVRTELSIQEVVMLVCASRSQTVDEITTAAGISHCTCHKILSDDLNMSHVTQNSVPRILTQDQCDDCMSICSDLINSAIPMLADLPSVQRQLF